MEKAKLVPYNLYLHAEHVTKLKELAGERKASSLIREALSMMLDGDDKYSAGYNRALKDAAEIINKCKEIEVIAIRGKYLADVLMDEIESLKK